MTAGRFVWRPWAVLAAFATAAWVSFAFLEVDLRRLLTGESAGQIASFIGGFFPPDVSPAFLRRVLDAAVETLAISALGTFLAALAGAVLALPAAGRWGPAVRVPARLVLNFLRSIPELVWATFMVLAAGLGPFAGCLALAVHTSGVLGRLFGETLENAPREPANALHHAGSGSTVAFIYGTLPLVLPQFASYSLYRWEYNIRMAAVLGFVGAGGLGQLLYTSLSWFQLHQAATVLMTMLAIVFLVDILSAWLRRHLGRSSG